jgi:uncharacterized protein YdeI (YjbR/CyaY-like superfamily)
MVKYQYFFRILHSQRSSTTVGEIAKYSALILEHETVYFLVDV